MVEALFFVLGMSIGSFILLMLWNVAKAMADYEHGRMPEFKEDEFKEDDTFQEEEENDKYEYENEFENEYEGWYEDDYEDEERR